MRVYSNSVIPGLELFKQTGHGPRRDRLSVGTTSSKSHVTILVATTLCQCHLGIRYSLSDVPRSMAQHSQVLTESEPEYSTFSADAWRI